MEEIKISLNAKVYDDLSELSKEDQVLFKKAIEAREKAYAPYSEFNVGAAILLDTGEIITGNNQENAAYPSGMCAERVAIWKAASENPKMVVKKLAITAASEKIEVKKPVGPCGACRQTLSEYEFKQEEPIEILFTGETGKIIKVNSLKALLPFTFNSSYL